MQKRERQEAERPRNAASEILLPPTRKELNDFISEGHELFDGELEWSTTGEGDDEQRMEDVEDVDMAGLDRLFEREGFEFHLIEPATPEPSAAPEPSDAAEPAII
ncbi:unnamed protein product [Caenorhabditis sp. 36 PRJEB53466]|nr:unnamed protein product [Caenorhabditis sp. 36 PRJEB53466]